MATAQSPIAPVGQGFNLNAGDLRFILKQIHISEEHAAGGQLFGNGPNQVADIKLPYGLRTVDGSWNNLVPGQQTFGKADMPFPRMLTPEFRAAEGGTTYATRGTVSDSQPRLVSNLIVDQSQANPAAVVAAGPGAVPDASGTFFIPNTAPDVGLSAPFNSLFTLFGQFFDHGLDLVTKGGGTVFIPLQPDDPLFVPGSPTNFMVLSRAQTPNGQDGINTTTPFVDQNQTYTSHPSHQVFLRAYTLVNGRPVGTGKLIDGAIAGNIGNWNEVKAQARNLLGIALADVDVLNVPLLATDPYGHFIRGPNGFPQVVMPNGLVEGNPAAPVSVANSVKTGHAFLDDIAHHAVPFGDHDNNPGTPPQPLAPDADAVVGDDLNPATYDDELLGVHFITGDGRGNENIGLTAIHSVFHAEHNRLADDIDNLITGPGSILTPAEVAEWQAPHAGSGWDYGERLFQAARFVTEMEYQHLVFEEFARKVQPLINAFSEYTTNINPAIAAEFAHTVYRFGHSMLTETVARTNADNTPNDLPLLTAFLNPLAFNDGGTAGQLTAAQAIGSIFRGMSQQVGNEIDEFVTEALRNRLLGLPLDLATINLARGRSEGIPGLNPARRQFFAATGNGALAPYASWVEFGLNMRHPESLANFVAAYGTHPSITGGMAARRAAAEVLVASDPANPATPADASDFMFGVGTWAGANTGLDSVDFWVGGLAEKQAPFGGLLGSTMNFVFELQLENLQNGDRFYYLSRTAGLNLLVQLEGNSFAELVMRNSDVDHLPADAFARLDFLFNLNALGTAGAILDDPATAANEAAMPDLFRMPDGTIRYNGPAHVIFTGTDDPAVVDRIWSSEGDDTVRGNGGRDFIEGGAGNDVLIGGEGDDIITDSFGDDVLKGGDGNDVLSSGQGFGADLNQGGRGADYILGGSDLTESFGGPGNDIIFAGDSTDTVFGDDGDDWMEGGDQADLLQGDNGAPFFNDLNQPGNDVIIGDGGNDDYDMEGGDDIGVVGIGIEKVVGSAGFDWATYRNGPTPANADLNIIVFAPVDVNVLRDKFKEVEGLSGWNHNDVLRGSDRDAVLMVGHELTAGGIDRIAGLSALLGGATFFTGGDILLGGGGSDVIEGRSGDDIIDGDSWLNVQLLAPNPANGGTQLVDSMLALRADVLAGRINPGDISIVRSIVNGGQPGDIDTAVFSGALAEYTITQNNDGSVTVAHVAPAGGGGGGGGGAGLGDGVDTLINIERLAFTDAVTDANGTVIAARTNTPATGSLVINDSTPTEDQALTVTSTIADADGINMQTWVLTWEVEIAPGLWAGVSSLYPFAPNDTHVGRRLRVTATFNDNAAIPNPETITSAPTAPILASNDTPTGAPVVSNTTPQVGQLVTAITNGIADPDGLGTFSYQWMSDGVAIPGATGASFVVTSAEIGHQLTVRISYTDQQGFAEVLISAATLVVTPPPLSPVSDPGTGGGGGGLGGDPNAPLAVAGGGSGGGCSSGGGAGAISLAGLAMAVLALRRRRVR